MLDLKGYEHTTGNNRLEGINTVLAWISYMPLSIVCTKVRARSASFSSTKSTWLLRERSSPLRDVGWRNRNSRSDLPYQSHPVAFLQGALPGIFLHLRGLNVGLRDSLGAGAEVVF